SFFFQAEDGIRDFHVTGVQTCALPILKDGTRASWLSQPLQTSSTINASHVIVPAPFVLQLMQSVKTNSYTFSKQRSGHSVPGMRSEERRVGKECRSLWCSNR